MDSFWIIFSIGFLAIFDGCHSIYEIKAKRTLDAQTHWRPITSLGVQVPSAQRFFSIPNLEPAKYRIGQQLNNNSPYVFRPVKPPSQPIQPIQQYRNPFTFYQKPNKPYLGVQKPSQKFLATSTSHTVFGKHELPSLMNSHYFNDFHTSTANIAPVFKPFPVLKTSSQQNLGTSLHNPVIYRDLSLPHIQSTPYPPLITHQLFNTPTTPKITYESNKTPLRFPADTLSSYSFFGPAAHLVRNQQWPTQGLLGNLAEASFKTSTTALPVIIPSTSFRLNLLPTSIMTTTSTENPYQWNPTKYPSNFDSEANTKSTIQLPYNNNNNWSQTPDPLTPSDFSKILVPPPFFNRDNLRNSTEGERHENMSPFGNPKDVIITNQNFISTTTHTPIEHFTIKSESAFPANRDVFPNLNIALTTERPSVLNFNHVNQIINEIEKVKTKNSMAKPENDSESLKNRFAPVAPVQENYNSRHNFFTINDAITMPPFMKHTVHSTIVNKSVFNDQLQTTPSVNSPVTTVVETTTKSQSEFTSIDPIPSNHIKMRRRYPITRLQSMSTEKQIQPVRTVSEISFGKQRNITSTTVPTRGLKRPKVNQRKRTRTRTTTEATVRTSTSSRSLAENDERNTPIQGTISTFTGLSNRLSTKVKDSTVAENMYSSTSVQTTPALLNRPKNTIAAPSQDENIEDAEDNEQSISSGAPSTTPIATQIYSSLKTFNMETSTLDERNVEENLTKEPMLEAALSTTNLQRLKTLRQKSRSRPTTPKTTTTSSQVPEKIETPPDLTTSSTEEPPKVVKLRPVTTFELKRPRFSVKDYRTRLRTQLRSTSTTSESPNIITTPSTERAVSKLPTRRRILATFKPKPITNDTNNEKPVETEIKESANSSALDTPPLRKRNDQNSEAYRNAVRMRTSTTSTESSAGGIPKIRKQLSRPRYSTLKERIQTYKSRKPKPEDLEHQTSDDLVNITIEVKHDPTTEMTKLESAIMKIAKQDSSHKNTLPFIPQEMVSGLKPSGESSNNSEYIAQLTSGSAKIFNTMKIGGSRGIPEYFTIATDDPILPIEAFFPNVKKDKSAN